MSIEFEHEGKKYRADTAKEAVELQRLLEKKDLDRSAQPIRHWPVDVALDFINGMGEMQKKFLAILADGASIPSDTMVDALRLDSEIALAGVLSGLSKQAKKMKVNPHNIYYVEVEWAGKKKERYFRLMSDFRDALTELNWPDAWESEKKKE